MPECLSFDWQALGELDADCESKSTVVLCWWDKIKRRAVARLLLHEPLRFRQVVVSFLNHFDYC